MMLCMALTVLSLEHDDQKHFEALLAEDGVRMAGGHHDGFALVQNMRLSIDGNTAGAVQAGDKRVAAGGMRADFLILIEGKQRHADGVILRQRLADNLSILIRNLLLEREHLSLCDVFHGLLHDFFLLHVLHKRTDTLSFRAFLASILDKARLLSAVPSSKITPPNRYSEGSPQPR